VGLNRDHIVFMRNEQTLSKSKSCLNLLNAHHYGQQQDRAARDAEADDTDYERQVVRRLAGSPGPVDEETVTYLWAQPTSAGLIVLQSAL
jgi:hypothetical protein